MKIYKTLFFKSVLLSFLFFGQFTTAQILDPVQWSFSSERINAYEAVLIIKAKIEKHWHLYSQIEVVDGPIPTSFSFKENNQYELIGKTEESKPIVKVEPVFDNMELRFFENEAIFRQKVKVKSDKKISVEGELEFMVCDETRCLPPELVPFKIDVSPVKKTSTKEDISKESNIDQQEEITTKGNSNGLVDPVKWTFSLKKLKNNEFELVGQAKIEKGWHLYSQNIAGEGPVPTSFKFTPDAAYELIGATEESKAIREMDKVFEIEVGYFDGEATFKQKLKSNGTTFTLKGEVEYMVCNDVSCTFPDPEKIEIEVPATGKKTGPSAEVKENAWSWMIVIKGFLGGLLALLTPCVFPMIPLTVSFFTKQSKTKAKGVSNAIIYGLSIIAIYTLLGMGVTIGFGPDALNALSTNTWFNIAFFVLLVVFAISFLGAFDITLPSSWVNKADQASDKGGLIGIFFMAFTLSLVSFSCTGPIIGTLLVDAAVNGSVVGPTLGMLGFSLALALPFGLFAAFPGWLNTLPKSGGWLNSVKVVLGFLELALALKFLSNADLVIQAGWLKRELFLAIWIAIFGMMTLYLLGLIKFPHDSDLKHLSVLRVFFAMIALIFTIYLIPGLWGAPLKMISGFPPPMFYSESPNGVGGSAPVLSSNNSSGEIIGDPAHCPHNLNCFHDYEEGMAYAKKVGKPVMLDFTGWACVNCRKMEEQVWSDQRVLKRLREDVVLISLYVDEKLDLPKEEQIEVEIGGKKKMLKTVGNKWSYFQASRYQTNSQPQYILLDHEEKMLNAPAAYDPNIQLFIDWLDEGIGKFKK